MIAAVSGNGAVIGLIDYADGLATLGDDAVPEIRDLLVAGEGEAEGPAVDGGGGFVGDGDAGDEARAPIAIDLPGDLAASACLGRWDGVSDTCAE